ncbi:MAG: tetratricopeptide repeat protein [bacterium]
MISNVLDRISFWSLFIVLVLLPIFFLPFVKVPVETSKGLLLVVGLTISIIFWTAARFSGGKIIFPKSWVLVSALGVTVAFLLAALFSTASRMSFFGIMFDVGTFWFMFAAFLLMLVSSVVLRDSRKAKLVLLGVVVSFGVVFIFQILRIFAPQALSLGVLGGKTDNVFGTWNALGLFAGFAAIVSLFLTELFALSKRLKWVLGTIAVLALVMAAIVNFIFVWEMIGIFALIVFIYKISLYSSEMHKEDRHKHFPIFSLVIIMVSLLFFMTGNFIGSFLPNHLGTSNIEISPSLGTTMKVTGSALRKDPVFGIGPNRFTEVWAAHKPVSINSTQFWDASFNAGSGTIPTFASTTGSLGILAWLAFIVLFVWAGVKSFSSGMKHGTGQDAIIFFIASVYLFVASFFYPTGTVLFLLAFAFTGVFVGLSAANRENGEIVISFLDDPRKSFFSILFLVLVMIITAATGFKFVERFASVPYFGSAVAAQTVPQAQSSINKALSLYANDLYFRTYAQIYLVQLNSIVAKGQNISDADKATLQSSFDQAISGANSAVAYNPSNYLNYTTLGAVYETVAPFGVTGAYDKAVEAYEKAGSLNPLNPGIKLSLARLSLTSGKSKEAKDFANQALSLKPDYIDAYIILSQAAKADGNNAAALSYAEQALGLSPNDKSLQQYVGTLKGAPAAPADTKKEDTKKAQ